MAYDGVAVYRAILTIAGILPRQWEEPWKNQLYRVYGAVIDVHVAVYSLLSAINTLEVLKAFKGNSSFFVGPYESIIILLFTFERFLYRWKINNIVRVMDMFESFWISSNDDNRKTERVYNKLANGVVLMYLILAASINIHLIIHFTANHCNTGGKLMVSQPCKQFLVEIWNPFDFEYSSKIMFIVNFLQVVYVSLTFIIVYVTVPFLTLHMSCQFKLLADTFQNYPHEVKYGKHYGYTLLSITKHHQYMLSVAQEMNASFHLVLLFRLSFSCPPIVALALTLSKIQVGSALFSRCLLDLITLVTGLLMICSSGEQLSHNSLQVLRGVYLNSWYNLPLKDQQLLLVVAMRAQRPVRLCVWPHFVPICMHTFLKVINFCYSAYSVFSVAGNNTVD